MSIFNRKKKVSDTEMSDEDKIVESNKRIKQLESKKSISGYQYTFNGWQPIYKDNRKNRKINDEIEIENLKIELAEENRQNPQQASRKVTYDYSKTTTVEISPTVTVNSGNKKGLVDSLNGSGNDNGNNNGNSYSKNKTSAKTAKQQPSSEPAEPAKHSKVKTAFAIIGLVVLIGALSFSVVYLSTCINSKKDAQSTAAAIFASTSE